MKAHGLSNLSVPGWAVSKDEKKICEEFCRKAGAWLKKRGEDDSGFMVEQVNWGGGSLSDYKARKAAWEARGRQMQKKWIHTQ